MVRCDIVYCLPSARDIDGTRVLLCEQVQDVSSSLMALATPTLGRGGG